MLNDAKSDSMVRSHVWHSRPDQRFHPLIEGPQTPRGLDYGPLMDRIMQCDQRIWDGMDDVRERWLNSEKGFLININMSCVYCWLNLVMKSVISEQVCEKVSCILMRMLQI